jgi:rare lipoprotein A
MPRSALSWLAVALTTFAGGLVAAAEQPASFADRWPVFFADRWAALPEPVRTALSLPSAASDEGKQARAYAPASNKQLERKESSYGLASYYWQGSRTASGEKFDKRELTAAHRTLPFGTRVRVTDVKTGRSVTVRVNDRGPFIAGRVIDVSQAAAQELGMVGRGVAKVKLDVVR